MTEISDALRRHIERVGGLTVGDVFTIDDVTFRVTAHDGFGVFHFEKVEKDD